MRNKLSEQAAVTLSIRISAEARDQLENLADVTGRTKSFLAAEAVENYLENHAWQITAIQSAVNRANSNNAKFVEHEKVKDWLNSWGEKDEKESS